MTHTVDHSPRPASGALTPTGGFLRGFTHTLQPYIGCQFACEYCYVKGLAVHRFHRPVLEWGEYAHPRTDIATCLNKELRRFRAKGNLDKLAIFMSSATDPYQFLERRHRLARACLDTMIEHPPGRLVVQTRSPFVADDLERLKALGNHCWLNFTLETDLDEVRRLLTPYTPAITKRLAVLQLALEAGLNVQITVSPCLPFSSVEKFGKLLLDHGHRVIIDTFTSGDGLNGKRTATSDIPNLYTKHGWGDWHSETQPRALFKWLQSRIGERVGWSQDGFLAVTLHKVIGC